MSRQQQPDTNPSQQDAEENLARSFTNKTDALMGLFVALPPPLPSPGKHIHSESWDQDETPRIQKKVRQTETDTMLPSVPIFLSSPQEKDEQTPLLSASSQSNKDDLDADDESTTAHGLPSSASFRATKGTPPTPQVFDSLFGEDTTSSSKSMATPGLSSSCLTCDASSAFIALCAPSTWIGSCVFLLYHAVYCLAHHSTATCRSQIDGSLGTNGGSGCYYSWTNHDLLHSTPNSVFPAFDLFLAAHGYQRR